MNISKNSIKNKIEKLELQSRVKMKILEKKPTNGGTPADERKEIKIILVRTLFIPTVLK